MEASLFADKWKAEAVVPQAALEVLQSYLAVGKIPAVNRFFTAAGDKIKSRFVRGALTAGAVNVGETVTEELQYLTPYAVQELAHDFATDTGIDSVQWHNGKDGALDGIWTRAGVNFIAMGPMSAGSIPGVLGRDQRMRAFAEATPTQRLAFGITAEDSAAIEAAALRGPSSLAGAVDTALENRDPNSESAAAAVKEMERQHEARVKAVEFSQQTGLLPKFIPTPEGIRVMDSVTGEEIGIAKDGRDAVRMAATHSAMVNEENEHQVAYLATLIDAGADKSNSASQTALDPFREMTKQQQAALSSRTEERVFAQSKASEALGRDPGMSEVVHGKSVTDLKRRARRTANTIYAGGSVLTVVHEDGHGFFREALRQERLTIPGTIEAIRGFQAGMDPKYHFLPAEGEVTETQVDEAVSELLEVLILKNRKKGGVTADLVSRNLSSYTRMNGAGNSLKSFVDTVRDYFGLVFTRVYQLKQSIRDGTVKESAIDGFANSLFGLDGHGGMNPDMSGTAEVRLSDEAFSFAKSESGRRLPQKRQPVSSQKQFIPKTSDRLDSSLVDDPTKYPPHEHKQIVESWLHAQGVITDPDGETVLMPNPDEGTVAERAWHLIASKDKADRNQNEKRPRYYNDAKAASVFSILQTITDYQVKGVSPDGTQIGYFRKYGSVLHMVLVNKASGRQRHHGLSTHRPVTGGGGVADIDVDKVRTALNEEPYTPEPDKELPDWTGPDRTTEEDSIPGTPDLTDDQLMETEDRAYEQIQRSRVLDVDAVLPHIPGYNEAHPLTRDRAYRRTARDITRKLLDRLLSEPKKTGKVIIVSGGAGSGKSTIAPKFVSKADFIIDVALSDLQSTTALINHITESKRKVDVVFSHRDFGAAYENTIKRYLNANSARRPSAVVTPLDAAIATHLESIDLALKIRDIPVTVIDNNHSPEKTQNISLEQLAKTIYGNRHERITRRPSEMGGGNTPASQGRTHGKGPAGASRNRGDSRGTGPAARLEAIGLEIIEGFRTSGRLTNAEAAAFAGGVGQIQVRLAGAHQALPQRRISASEIGSVGRRLEDLSRGVGGGEDASRIGSDVLGKWGAETGLLIDPDWWKTIVTAWPKTPSGTEHDGFRDNQSHRVLSIQKSSIDRQAGLQTDYLKSIQLINLIFEDDIRIEGIVDLKDKDNRIGTSYSLVTSHPFTDGTHPSAGQIENWMSSRGYSSEGNNTYYNRDTDVRVKSATPENFIKTGNGNLLPLGVTVESDFSVEELTELIGGI